MFVRSKDIYGNIYYYLCETNRNSGQARQRVLAYLGKHTTIESALQALYQERSYLEQSKVTPRIILRLTKVNERIVRLERFSS
jgi:hypothetical protein